MKFKVENLATTTMTQGNQKGLNIHHQQQRGYHRGANHSHTKDTWDPLDFITHHIELLWKKANVSRLHSCPDWQGPIAVALAIINITNNWLWKVVRASI